LPDLTRAENELIIICYDKTSCLLILRIVLGSSKRSDEGPSEECFVLPTLISAMLKQ
jgi:hypothetical protein